MADDTLHTKVISKNNSGFPDYLDFDKLRREGIEYLGKLAGKIWTDHNVHDPGITILESLCYALLDLGYRTNLPVEDILSRAPNGKDNNFFTPAQILTCNPLTIIDYRKLLIDISGVKNAWLEVATDQKDPCRENRKNEYLNGLYHVYIETEEAPEVNQDDIFCKVKKALMAHRNLCEDFVDVSILCKLPIGVCADIELDANAEAEKVYVEIAQQLRAFFSPGPRFYTLPQLLDKKIPIEDIFAGRPYNVTESHGFVDTNELEQIPLRKVVHLSDVYNVIFQVAGVRKIKNLKLRLCEGELANGSNWEIPLPKNHLPEFTIGCSGFQFLQNGNPITIDTARYEGLLSINFANTGKILYSTPLPNLDSEIPLGIYRPDMGDYYSIQNDFPRVYGIGEGGLPDSAPDARKAQAWQLKAYLLFFDQLLANYLSQLKNIRSLFDMAAPEAGNRHTYFLNGLDSVPDLGKLLRMPATEEEALNSGGKGSTLVYPVSKSQLLQWKEANPNIPFDPDALPPYTFGSLAEQEILLQQLKENLSQQQYEKGRLGYDSHSEKDPSCFNYYLAPFSTDFALISKRTFTKAQAADTETETAVFVAGFDDNYRTFITNNNRVSFDIELNLAAYSNYLQNIVEDDAGYASRRNTFLDHLLSRFAEQFTDFAQLSYKQFATEKAATLANIKAKEEFLTHYDDISSNRGKAYDYVENNWNTDNISGFEKTVKYTSGIENKKEHSLCNFIVSEYDDLFQVNIRIAGNAFYALPEKFNSRLEAQETARDVFMALSDPSKLTTRYLAHERLYTLQLLYGNNKYTNFADTWDTEQQAEEVRQAMVRLFDPQPYESDVYISDYMYRLHLLNNAGDITRTAREFTTIEEEAKNNLQHSPENINNPDIWQPVETIPQPGNNLYLVSVSEEQVQFIDVTVFKIDIDNTIIGHPDKFTYEVLDQAHTFKFSPVEMFSTTDEAMAHCHSVLALAAIDTNYQVGKNKMHQKFTLYITGNGVIQAICAMEFDTEEEALEEQKKIYSIIRNWVYRVITDKSPYRWRYNFLLGYKENERFTFTSIPDYTSSDAAFNAAVILHRSILQLEARQQVNRIILSAGKKNKEVPEVAMPAEAEPSPLPAVQLALDTHKRVYPLIGNTEPQAYNEFVELDEISQQGRYVYRLVDKDNIYATWSQAYYTKEDAEEARRRMQTWLRQSHVYLDICLGGGNLITERTDVNGTATSYHYVVKCHNLQYQSGPQQGEPLVLFESVTGYTSASAAEQAFNQQYLQVFDKATDINNYGTIISLDETILDNPFRDSETLVFVPAVTVDYFRSISTQPVAEQIAAIVKTYPVKKIKYGSDQFRRLFPCENVAQTTECSTASYVYYFSLQADAEAGTNWQSLKYYTTPEEARKDFLFFIMLLKYAGNLFVDCDNCNRDSKYPWRIYIREVLAESARRFLEEPFAWGEDGIEKFICAVQSGSGFHNHLRPAGCCYSFYLNSGADFITHPCKYDSADKRTAVMQELYYQLQRFQSAGAYSTQWEANTLLVKDHAGQPFAQHIFDSANDQYNCNWLVQLPNKITDSNNRYIERDGSFFLLDTREQVILQSYKSNYTLESWKAELLQYACYYPIVEYTDEATKSTRYCIEIRIPGFHTCGDDQPGLQPCGCNDESAIEPDCYLAWKSTCCYTTCDDAQTVLAIAYRLLLNFSNYQPEFDCESNSYGIALAYNTAGQQPLPKNIKLSGSLVAYNPQCYTAPEYVCDAVERTKKLTNGEGLHLVEHILLRPNTSDDCANRISLVCPQRTHPCKFEWEVEQKDPCNKEEDDDDKFFFEPGVDPYSFIATIVLPAWSARFRTPEGRLLIENILYRSAPAHVMLRILWLAPHDFCCFEEKYKSWRRYLARKRVCNQNFSVNEFLEFLFHRKFEELDECKNTDLCATTSQVQDSPCIAESKQRFRDKQISFADEVNEEYCWKAAGEYVWIPCDKQQPQDPIDVKDNQPVVIEEIPVVEEAEAPVETEAVEKAVEPVAKPQPKEEATSMTFIRRKALFVNSRLDGYRRIAREVIDKSNNNPLAIDIEEYLGKPSPTPKKTESLVDRLLENAKPEEKGVKRLSREMKKDLVAAVVRFYLDKISFGAIETRQVKQSGGIFEKIRNAKINVQDIYNDWNGAEVKTYEPDVNLDALYELVTGIK